MSRSECIEPGMIAGAGQFMPTRGLLPARIREKSPNPLCNCQPVANQPVSTGYWIWDRVESTYSYSFLDSCYLGYLNNLSRQMKSSKNISAIDNIGKSRQGLSAEKAVCRQRFAEASLPTGVHGTHGQTKLPGVAA